MPALGGKGGAQEAEKSVQFINAQEGIKTDLEPDRVEDPTEGYVRYEEDKGEAFLP